MLLTSASRGRVQILGGIGVFVTLILLFRANIIDTWSNRNTEYEASEVQIEVPSKTSLPVSNSITSQTTTPTPKPNNPCDGFPDTSDILVVMKTGATEAYDKLPIHFMTTLKCMKDFIIFSDMEMHMAEHHLIDVLDQIGEDVRRDNQDFKLYETLKSFEHLGQDPRTLKDGGNGWNLDKYKFLPMLVKTWEYRKDAKWYVFIEADSAVNWKNMRTFLDKLDAKKSFYIGSPTYLDIQFAHGGTGYVISGTAMKKAVGGHLDIQQKYDSKVHDICCGDRMISRVLLDEGIKLTIAWPMFNGEKPITLPFGESHWCQPVLTMHHMTAQEVSKVWNFEQKRKQAGNNVTILPPEPKFFFSLTILGSYTLDGYL
jgi:hypothetical protein